MTDRDSPLLTRIEASRDQLTSSEARVANVILSNPNLAVELSISAMAAQAGVSEPTVARFCKSHRFSGLKEFKLQLARSLGGAQTATPHTPVSAGDGSAVSAGDEGHRPARSRRLFATSRHAGQLGLLAEAGERHIASARRWSFYGQGNSGIVALDGQHKFFRMGLPTGAYSDPHVHAMSAALLKPGDVVWRSPPRGARWTCCARSRYARESGANVIGVTTRGSPLMRLCNVTIAST